MDSEALEANQVLSAPSGWWATANPDEGMTLIGNMTNSHLLCTLFFLRRGAVELHKIETDLAYAQVSLARGRKRADRALYAAALRATDPWVFLDTVPKYQEIEAEVQRRGLL